VVVSALPRAHRRRLIAAIAAVSVAIGGVVIPLAAADDLKDKQSQLQRDIKRKSQDLQHSSQAARRASRALARAESRLETAQDQLATKRGELTAAQILDDRMQAKLEQAIADLQAARKKLRVGKRKAAAQDVQLSRFATSSYQSGDPGLMGLAMILRSEDPNDLSTQLNAVGNLMDRETTALERLEAVRDQLAEAEKEVAALKDAVAVQRQQAAENLEVKTELEQQAAAAEAQVSGLVSKRESAYTTAEAAKRADLRQLQRMEADNRRIQTLLRKRAAAAKARAERERRRKAAAGKSSNGGSSSGGSSGGGGGGSQSSGGYLSSPVNGYVTSGFGYRTHPIYGYRSLHDGVDFGAGCGQPLYAGASGTVVSRYYQSAWGNRLIIDHGYQRGVGLATIYNHAIRYTVGVGQRVQRGQVIGYVGTTGWSTGCHLHFTVMANGSAVNPMGWL
jgi:murein DD-endopeptidase MepM/ murein hydrolase activator NlpD